MGVVDHQATMIRERLAQRRRRRRVVNAAFIAVLLIAALVWLYTSYRGSVGTGRPTEPVTVLIAVIDGPEWAPVVDGGDDDVPAQEVVASPEAASQEAASPGAGSPEAGSSETEEEAAAPRNGWNLQAAAFVVIEPEGKGVTVISLPASTWWDGQNTLADAYADGGMAGLQRAAEGLLALPVHHRVRLDLTGFAALVDQIPGGVTVPVRSTIVYRSPEGEEIFRLEPGRHTLDGRAALYFLRYRGGDWTGEVPRALRQRDFARALAEKMLEGGLSFQEMWTLVTEARQHVETDLQLMQGVRLSELVWRTDPQRIDYMLLPGRAREGYWDPDEAVIHRLARRLWPQE